MIQTKFHHKLDQVKKKRVVLNNQQIMFLIKYNFNKMINSIVRVQKKRKELQINIFKIKVNMLFNMIHKMIKYFVINMEIKLDLYVQQLVVQLVVYVKFVHMIVLIKLI